MIIILIKQKYKINKNNYKYKIMMIKIFLNKCKIIQMNLIK